ncbi:beta-lactamase family protein [Pseudoalteromonas luteoviolacea]|uniref:serine hydrolase domain-containing protein n=1 Tax=Pseudoalteromonas luteoviolacea TaxID=43657 RepID=UPI001F302D2B|nr:serine hydrolase domain-containing protein [Pseudoalteromonas luteoviolacea]MCF6442857.1 beta-lactamase family protein [Pseudoalteromonas luteoviolacea]
MMTKLITTHIYPLIATFMLTACGGSHNSNTDLAAAKNTLSTPEHTRSSLKAINYQTLIDGLVSDNVHGIILHVSTPEDVFTGSSGIADLATQAPLEAGAIYHLASTGKVFTALLAVKLDQQGLLDLDATIDTWLPERLTQQILFSEQITLRQLLNHSSGIYNYSDRDSADAYVEFVLSNYENSISNEDLLEFALGKPAYFKPGEGVEYSNSNYVLAGMILDKVLGQPNAYAMRDKIIDRLELTQTFSVGVEADLAGVTPGYELQDGNYVDTWPILRHVTAASTPVASTVADLSKLMSHIFHDDAWLSQNERNELIGQQSLVRESEELEYVLGLFKQQIHGYTVFHHSGANHGYISNNLYIPELKTSIVYFLNCGLSAPCQDAFYDIEAAILDNIGNLP